MRLATGLINAPLEEIEKKIQEMMAVIGSFTRVDRVYIFEHDLEEKVTSNTFEWCAPGISTEIDNLQCIPFTLFDAFIDLHQKGETVCIPRLHELDEDIPIRALLMDQGILSIVLIPLLRNEIYIGFVGFDSVREARNFSETEINLLKVFAEIIANALSRKETDKALQESEKLKRHLLEAIPDILIRLDRSGMYLEIMTRNEELLIMDKSQVIGRRIIDLIPNDDGKRMTGAINQALESGDMATIEYSLRVPVGVRQFEARIVPYLEDEVLCLIRDVTEEKQTEDALHMVIKKLNLLSGITRHDILNKINAINLFLDNASALNKDPRISEYLTHMEEATGSIERQIAFTREYQELGMRKPVWLSVTDWAKRNKNSAIQILCDCDTIYIYADPMAEKVFNNLYDNTIRHGGGADRIIIRCDITHSGLQITWEDNGPGIPDDQKEKIFEAGYGKNTGFGLFLSREILGITGISIIEMGEYGKGAQFIIQVPADGYSFQSEDV